VVGAQRVRASVNVEYDPSSSEESQETYDPKSAVVVASQMSQEQVGGGVTSGGIPGTSSNVPAENGAKPAVVKPSEEDAENTQISKSENNTYAVNKVVRHIVEPAGRIRRISAALLVDDAVDVKQENGKRSEVRRKRTPEELKQIETLAKAAIGVDLARGDTLTVQNLSFDQTPVEAPVKPTTVERVRVMLNDWSSIVRYATLIVLFLLAYALLLKPLKKQLLTTFKELPARVASQNSKVEIASGHEMAALSPEQRATALKRQLGETVRTEPAAATKLIQSWLNEGAR
jgi:flagellar M-ring protein FliF